MGRSKLENLAYNISLLLTEHGCHGDVAIYFEGKRLTTLDSSNYGKWVLQDGFKASDYTDYANDDTITMTFEGEFYHTMNYGDHPTLLDKFASLLADNGYWYELGNAWNLALYKE